MTWGHQRSPERRLRDAGRQCTPGISRLVLLDAGMRAHGCHWCATPCHPTIVRGTSCRSAGIDKGPGGGPHTHDDAHRCATGRTAGRERGRGRARERLARAGVSRHNHQADGRQREGTARMEKADMPDFHKAIGEDVLKEAAEKLHAVEVGSTWACTAHFSVGERDRTVREADEALVGESDLEDRGGEGGEGGVAVGVRLTVDVPGDSPDLGIDVLQETGSAHVFFEDGAVERGEGFDGYKEVGAGGQPGRAVLGEATARNDGVDVRVVLELPAPGMQDPGEPREVGPDEALICGQPCEGRCRRLKHGLVREALRRADEGSECLGDGEGEEEGRPGQLCVQVTCKPLLGLMLLALGTVAVATGMLDAVLASTAWALREALSVMAATAVLDGADDLAVYSGESGIALQILRGKRCEDIAERRHGSSPCMRALRRS